jgi:hypothetical protein
MGEGGTFEAWTTAASQAPHICWRWRGRTFKAKLFDDCTVVIEKESGIGYSSWFMIY